MTAPVIKPSLRRRMFIRSMALESVQVSNRLSFSNSSGERSAFVGNICDVAVKDRPPAPCVLRREYPDARFMICESSRLSQAKSSGTPRSARTAANQNPWNVALGS